MGKSASRLFPIFSNQTQIIGFWIVVICVLFPKDKRSLPKSLLYIIYVLIIIIGLVAMYSLLNAGNPDSLLRPIFPDPKYDLYVAMISSVLVFILGFFVFFSRDQESFRQLVALNGVKIRELRKEGKNNEEIAASILAAMGSDSGYRHNMARKKLLIYLSEFK
jgi:predicted membrane channel-forming protein YqfA (hemolysin III family)